MKKFHFIAIGGSAMHNLALALQFKGFEISGSDDAIFEPSKSRLAKAGLLPEVMGWYPEKIAKDLDGIILGMHAKEDNPELLKAMELGIRIYSYPEFLYEQTKNKTRVVIAGSHGKTTITSMVLHVLNYWEKEVDYMIGAQLEGFDTMVHLTEENDFMLIEGDEYLSSPIDRRPKFLWYKPHVTLISGIAWDHINVFPTEENYIEQFETYIDSIMPGGVLVYNESDSVLEPTETIYDYKIQSLTGSDISLADYKGKKILFVNVASKCGFTPQYEELQKLSEQYKDKLVIIGLPCNQFGAQESGTSEEIATFCTVNYGVTFLITEKIKVKGDKQHDIYKWLTSSEKNGKMDSKVKWNFQKYMIDEKGRLINVFYSQTKPLSSKITSLL